MILYKLTVTGVVAQDTKPQIRTILVTPKEAARIVNMGGGVPVVSPRKAAVTSWQTTTGTAAETDLLSTLSAAGKGLFTLTLMMFAVIHYKM